MTISEEIDRIAKRLLADVDDRMEFAGTEWKSKDTAAKQVQEALDKAKADLYQLMLSLVTTELPKGIDETCARLIAAKLSEHFNEGED